MTGDRTVIVQVQVRVVGLYHVQRNGCFFDAGRKKVEISPFNSGWEGREAKVVGSCVSHVVVSVCHFRHISRYVE
jgi:hypothetical protein